jgi:SAM-dependent methyltransferase
MALTHDTRLATFRCMNIDYGRTAKDYGRHRAGFPEAFFDRLSAFGIGRPGQRVLDFGTGTGTVARGLARRGCDVTGLDPAAALIEEARRLDREAGVEVAYVVGRAESSGLPAGKFEAVTAGQCWHWLDRRLAAEEARRLLVPGGALVIAHFDWLPLAGSVVEATERLILAHNPAWPYAGLNGIHSQFLGDVSGAGFTALETFSFDVDVSYGHETWRGRIRASAGVAASLPRERVARFDEAHAAMLAKDFPEDPLAIPHRVWAIVARAPAR